jgi:hypothetical protein
MTQRRIALADRAIAGPPDIAPPGHRWDWPEKRLHFGEVDADHAAAVHAEAV